MHRNSTLHTSVSVNGGGVDRHSYDVIYNMLAACSSVYMRQASARLQKPAVDWKLLMYRL